MKSIKLCLLIILLLTAGSFSQNNDFNLESLKAPSMPAASIIGIQVSEVNQPKSLKTLETAVFSNYFDSEQNFSLPENYALEINPYMIGGMVNYDYMSYIENNISNNIWQNFFDFRFLHRQISDHGFNPKRCTWIRNKNSNTKR